MCRPRSSTGRGRERSGRPSSCPRPSCGSRSILRANGRRDIVDSAPDALASTANYLAKSGWRSGLRVGLRSEAAAGLFRPVGAQSRSSRCRSGRRSGLTRIDGRALGEGDAGLLLPAGPEGPAFLVTRNFDAVYSYNAAESYTLAACVLADRLGGGRGHRHALADRRSGALARRAAASCRRCLRSAAMTSAAAGRRRSGPRRRQAIADFQQKNGLRG